MFTGYNQCSCECCIKNRKKIAHYSHVAKSQTQVASKLIKDNKALTLRLQIQKSQSKRENKRLRTMLADVREWGQRNGIYEGQLVGIIGSIWGED